MMEKSIIDQIERLKIGTRTEIGDMVKGLSPTEINIKLHRAYYYHIGEKEYRVYEDGRMLFTIDTLPYTPNQSRNTFIGTLEALVKTEEVYPFLLFINNKFIKWSDITIIKDKYNYFFVNCPITEKYTYNFVVIPTLNVTYNENVLCDTNDSIFSPFIFDNVDRYTQSTNAGSIYTTLDINNANMIANKDYLTVGKWKDTGVDTDFTLYKECTFFFHNGLYYRNDIETNALNLIKISDMGIDGDYIFLTSFYNKKTPKSKDNILSMANKQRVKDLIINPGSYDMSFIDNLNEFDFKYDKNKSYDDNIINSLLYIMKYNSKLMNKVIKDKSNISIMTYTGKQVLDRRDPITGCVTMSRRINASNGNYVMIFHNGNLYNEYNLLIYKGNNFIFPIIQTTIRDTDVIEVLYVKDIDNRKLDLKLDSDGDNIIDIDPSINMDNMLLFTIDPANKAYNIEYDKNILYEIDYTYSKISNSKIQMKVADSDYYDKSLLLASKRQFNYICKIVRQPSTTFILPDNFNMCNNYKNYMVFINGNKLDQESYRITTVKPTRPFDRISIYVNRLLQINDKLEIFYILGSMEEVYNKSDLDLSGNIVVDKTKLSYGLDKDIYMLFVNGKKILPSQMYDIDSNKLQIRTNLNSIKNISILKHVDDNDVLKELFDKNEDQLSAVYNSLSPELLAELFKQDNLDNINADININSIPMKMVMEKLIRDYWLRPGINNGEEFIYDYDTTYLDKDEDGNIVIDSLNGNIDAIEK